MASVNDNASRHLRQADTSWRWGRMAQILTAQLECFYLGENLPPSPQKKRRPMLSARLKCPHTLRPCCAQSMHPMPTPYPALATPHTATQGQQTLCCECIAASVDRLLINSYRLVVSLRLSSLNRWLCQRVGCHHEMTWEAGKRVREQRKKKNRGGASSGLAPGKLRGQLPCGVWYKERQSYD